MSTGPGADAACPPAQVPRTTNGMVRELGTGGLVVLADKAAPGAGEPVRTYA